MGIFSSFSASSNSISPMEFRNKVRSSLKERGLSHRDIEQLESVVKLSLEESGMRRGLDRREVDQAVVELRQNRNAHGLSDHQIDITEEVLKKHLS